MLHLAALLLVPPATAQETVDIGVIKNSDVRVVQKKLYPKDGRLELGAHVGWMPFDAYLTTPNLQLSVDYHLSENLSVGGVAGGGYGLKNGTYKELEGPAYQVAPYAYRYLSSVVVGAQYAPIYAKMSVLGAIVHFDVYGAARVGGSLEQSVIPDGGLAFAPTVSLAVGTRFFTFTNGAIRVELRDDMLIESRKLTQTTHLKQNANVLIGFTMLSKVKD